MAGLFSYDNKAIQFLSRLWDLFVLNLLFIIGCIPVITAGVSAIAAYEVGLKIVEDADSGIVVPFFRAFKENLRQGIILSVAYIVLIAALILDFFLFEFSEGNPVYFLIIGILSSVLVHVHFFYVFAIAARYRNSLFRHVTNSRRIFVRYFGRSILCTLAVAAEIWIFFFNGWLLMFVGAFIAPVLVIVTKSTFAIHLFKKIEAEGGSVSERADISEPDEKSESENEDIPDD